MLNEDSVISRLTPGGDNKVNSNLWYLDNGARNHMTGRLSKFKDLDKGVTGLVKFDDGFTVKIEGKGSIIFKCKNGEDRLLREVYFIPTQYYNIICLGQLSVDGNKVVLHGEYLWVHDEQEKLLVKVKRSANRIYKIIIEEGMSTCLLSKVEETSWAWHSRLGHVNFQAMKLMSNSGMAYGIPNFVQPKEVCKGFLLSKQTQKPFPTESNFMAKEKLELVHGDLCGPISPPTTASNMYFLLLIDDFSRMMWVYIKE